ncbi:hypothetical protein Q426_09720 [Streptococcus equi subsp. zooepidemicus CY]|nr:hypothetical protein Q426_09720 [Streptococcus equi subsp. zooepidemicus CY]
MKVTALSRCLVNHKIGKATLGLADIVALKCFRV